MENKEYKAYPIVIISFFMVMGHGVLASDLTLGMPEMALIPSGKFEMGCDDLREQNRQGRHTVDVDAFFIDLTEVTQSQFEKLYPEHQSRRHPTSSCDDCPVTKVSWYDAQAYCQAQGKDLPTEEQWEKAAGASDSCAYSWDGPVLETPEQIRASEKTRGGYSLDDGASAVGKYPANRYGIFDMVGNVWEWTSTKLGPYRVRRGGAWSDDVRGLRVAWRDWSAPETSFFVDVGFRCVSSVKH